MAMATSVDRSVANLTRSDGRCAAASPGDWGREVDFS